jgi:outer membrane murein-binding lipoprotein Lpp
MSRLNHFLAIAAIVGTSLAAGCGSGPVKSEQSGRLRSELAAIQADPELASRAPIAIRDADAAVTAAEQPQSNPALLRHLDYIADRKVKIAKAQAEARYADDKLRALQEAPPAAAAPVPTPDAPPQAQ